MLKAKSYIENNELQKNYVNIFLTKYTKQFEFNVRENSNVLDVGCGPGDITVNHLKPFLGEFNKIIGVDRSNDMIKYANENFENEKVKFLVSDIEIENVTLIEQFEAIFSFFCLHWVNPKKAIRNMYRYLKPKGEIFLAFCAKYRLPGIYESLYRSGKWRKFINENDLSKYPDTCNNSKEPIEDFKNYLLDEGFSINGCEIMPLIHTFETKERAIGFFRSLNVYLNQIPTELHALYLEDVFDEALKLKIGYKDEQSDQYIFCFDVMIISAKKSDLIEP